MRIRVEHTLDDLEKDLLAIPRKVHRGGARVVRRSAERGNRLAKRLATQTAGTHGQHYPDRFEPEMITDLHWVYGPKGHPQGEMEFEEGSRNQPAHHDLANSLDVEGPRFVRDIDQMLDKVFW